MGKINRKNTILTKKIDGVLYEIMVMTNSDMVYTDPAYRVTLTEKLAEIMELLTTEVADIADLKYKFEDIVGNAPATFNTFKEVWDYVNVNGNPESELISILKSKVDSEEGKGLSTNDFTDVLYQKLVNSYSKEEVRAQIDLVVNRLIDDEERIDALETRMDTAETNIDKNTESITDTNTKVEEIETKSNGVIADDPSEVTIDQGIWYYDVTGDT